MQPQQHQRAKELFQRALDCAPAERDAFVASHFDDDSTVRDEVRRLLALHEMTSPFLRSPIESGAVDSLQGRTLGGFKITRRIGAGGMGAVYEAEQEHPHRKAAVKVLRAGFVSRATVRRFEYESEILAKLQHPGIAHVYASGAFDAGDGAQPWFAM
jgi:hypothetical protein